MVQGEYDDTTSWYEVYLEAGPWWRDVQVCVPQETINGFKNSNADEDDEQEWIIKDLKWTTDGEGAPNPGEVRIRLEFRVGLRGEASWLRWLGYHFTAAGRELGVGGIAEPGPIKTGPCDVTMLRDHQKRGYFTICAMGFHLLPCVAFLMRRN